MVTERAEPHVEQVLGLHTPLLRVVASALFSFVAVALLHHRELASASLKSVSIAFVIGFAYTQLFEYLYHRDLMHRIRGSIRKTHLRHHRIFHGDNYTTRSEKDLQHVVGRWYFFPPCFALHYLLARIAAGPELAVPFLAGCALHYVGFEISHWFAHVEDNLIDRVIERIPLLGVMRAAQLAHHRMHHQRPNVNFNFNAPYIGDVLGRTFVTEPQQAGEETPSEHTHAPGAALISGTEIGLDTIEA